MIRRSPVIRRRSGVRKFELDLRRPRFRLAPSPLKIAGVVFLSPEPARDRPLLRCLPKKEMLSKLNSLQPYAANQPRWRAFQRRLSQLQSFELRRGDHPSESVGALQALLGHSAASARDCVPCASH
jgi:hypothetical protein